MSGSRRPAAGSGEWRPASRPGEWRPAAGSGEWRLVAGRAAAWGLAASRDEVLGPGRTRGGWPEEGRRAAAAAVHNFAACRREFWKCPGLSVFRRERLV